MGFVRDVAALRVFILVCCISLCGYLMGRVFNPEEWRSTPRRNANTECRRPSTLAISRPRT
jgi:hypothetical protein